MKPHAYWMQHALSLAERAFEQDEVPVGAVLVYHDEIIAEGWNQPIHSHDPTSHAEINCLRKAASAVKNYRLKDTTLYVTLEPCAMCAGAIVHARVKHVVFGAYDLKAGAGGSVVNLLQHEKFNHHVEIIPGILEAECKTLLQGFFKARR